MSEQPHNKGRVVAHTFVTTSLEADTTRSGVAPRLAKSQSTPFSPDNESMAKSSFTVVRSSRWPWVRPSPLVILIRGISQKFAVGDVSSLTIRGNGGDDHVHDSSGHDTIDDDDNSDGSDDSDDDFSDSTVVEDRTRSRLHL